MPKRFISLLIALIAICSICCFSVNASDLISIKYSYTKSVSSIISVTGTTATAISTAVGYNGETTKIVIKQTLQKKNSIGTWTSLSTNSETFKSYKAVLSKKYTGLYKGTYRVKSVFTVYAGNNSETITKYSTEENV